MKTGWFGNALATYGRIESSFIAIIGILLGLAMIIAGSITLYDTTTGTVVKANCLAQSDGTYWCLATVKITVDDKDYYKNIDEVLDEALYTGEPIEVQHVIDDPSSMRLNTNSRRIGWALIGVGLLIVTFVSVIAYFSFRSKKFAMVEGGTDIISRLFNWIN